MINALGRLALAGLLLLAVILALLALANAEEAARVVDSAITVYEFHATEADLARAQELRKDYFAFRLKDPYDPRWWERSFTNRQRDDIEAALNDFLYDTDREGKTEAELYHALKAAGLDLRNLDDMVHAAYHITKPFDRTKPTLKGETKDGD